MSTAKNDNYAGKPALKYHRHGTWDMIDVPVAIRSIVDRSPSDPNRPRVATRTSASQLLFKPKPAVRHPNISEVCNKFESLSRDNSSDFGRGPNKIPSSKSREFGKPGLRSAPNNSNLRPKVQSGLSSTEIDPKQSVLQPSFQTDTTGGDQQQRVSTNVEFTKNAVHNGVPIIAPVMKPVESQQGPGLDDDPISISADVTNVDFTEGAALDNPPMSLPEEIHEDDSALGNKLLSSQITDRSSSELYCIQEDISSSRSSSSQSSSPLSDSVSKMSGVARTASLRESLRDNNAIDDDQAIHSDLDQNPFSRSISGSSQSASMAESNEDDSAKALNPSLIGANHGLEPIDVSSSDLPHPSEECAPDLNRNVLNTGSTNDILDSNLNPPTLISDRQSCSNGLEDNQSSESFKPPPDSVLTRTASESSSLRADEMITLPSRQEAPDQPIIVDDESSDRVTTRDISALLEMQHDDDSSDSSRSSSLSRRTSTVHGRHSSSRSESQIKDSARSDLPQPNFDDIILDDAMRSLSLHFASDDDSMSFPLAVRHDDEPVPKVRFDEESMSPQLEPRLDMFEYPLIKHGRRGHRRRIYLTVDMGAGIIRWGNGRRWMQIEHILQVRSGKETPVLKRRAAQDVDGRLCLSLITQYRSLDLECKTAEERKAVQLTIMNQIIGYLRHHNVRAGWIRPRSQST